MAPKELGSLGGDGEPKKPEEVEQAVGKTDRFDLFTSLAPELRHIIWGMYIDALPETPGLLIHSPSEFPPLENSTLAPPTVYTGFPATMHVSHEARFISRSKLTLVKSPTSCCMVPVRPFRPELDVLYIPWEAWRSFFLLKEFYYADAWMRELRHVAVDICFAANLGAFFRQVQHLPALQTLRFVLAEEGMVSGNSIILLPTPVDTRFDLREVDEREGEGIGEYLEEVRRKAFAVARDAVDAAPTPENHDAVERLIDTEGRKLNFEIGAGVLMEYRCSDQGGGFVEMGNEHVADLVLRIR